MARGQHGADSQPSEGANPVMPGFRTSSLQTVREQISAVKATQSVVLVMAARGN